jgi:diguanylate cyclase (GGDEF)-like protein
MQIRTLFLACMSAVAALTACLGGWTLAQMVVEYQLAGRVARAVDIDAMLFVASDRIGLERPLIGDALLMDAPADAAMLAQLAAIRRDADAALVKVEDRIAEVSYPGADQQLAVVQRTRADLAVWRTNVDATLRRAKSDRDPGIFGHYIVTLNAVFDATSVALDLGDVAASQHDGISVELMALARHVWTVRATMGVRTVPLMEAIDGGAMLDHDRLEEQAQYDGVLMANWTPITALSRRLAGVPGLAATIATARQASDDYDRLCHDVIKLGRISGHYQITALELGRNVVRTAPLLLKIRDEALATARARVTASRQAALAHVVIAAVVLLLTLVTMIGVLMLLQRRIVSPVVALTKAIGRIAQLDFDVAIPARRRMDEIGRMATALDALRRGAMAGEENKAHIIHLARHDALTGLPNRLALQEVLGHAVAMAGRDQKSAVLCLDLDRFKAVNDTFGHPTGDRLLQAVALRLLASVRDVDTVSRLGGDEFVVLLVGLDMPEHAAIVARRIVRSLSEPFDLDGQVVCIGSSIGIALTPQDATSAVTLLKCADTALYRAKLEEKGSWRFFKPEMDAHQQERMALEHDLRDAIAQEEFEIAYQPQYNLASDRLCGFEALLRWRHPLRGVIGPSTFIPIAEETGLIVPIGAWVLRQACLEAVHWPDDVRLAVNLSAIQFKNQDLLQTVRQALTNSGLPASRLELEITETVLLKNSPATLAVMHAMHAMGIHIAMDDFGTGYSSLSALRSFPFDAIKIDQSFIRDLSDQVESQAIVRAVVALGKSLGMTTTAEGVETEDQLAELRREGCTDAQGYLFSKPLPAADARLLLNQPLVSGSVTA